MKNTKVVLLAVSIGILLTGCATIVKSDKIPVRFVGGLPSGDTQMSLPDGQYTLKNGQTTILVSRSKVDIPITVTCNSETREGIITTKYDVVAGVLGNIVFGGLIGMGIDSVNNKAYDPPDTYNLRPLCADSDKPKLAEESSKDPERSPSSRLPN